ncbi:FEKKY domain-containing protein [Salinimicrobium xinjiangense]|uniref:FEKKY domain-containing protein n=1 Tax=Salinimicrobium xinjiangense TaxID=438596 RepID=UPI0004915734|nr:hypothetical protein [Salinimicrobium xinjiangense]
MNLKKEILTLIMIMTCGLISAQVEIRGTVLSELTGMKPEADIYIEVLKSRHPGTMADSLGKFRLEYLEPNKEYLLKISAFGFPTQEFEAITNTGITNELFLLKAECEFDAEKADSDWKNGKPKLLLFGSIAPVANTKADERFERNYKIEYYDFGCTPPAMDCLKLYNERIFELMDEKYGKEWRKKVRPDVEYLN